MAGAIANFEDSGLDSTHPPGSSATVVLPTANGNNVSDQPSNSDTKLQGTLPVHKLCPICLENPLGTAPSWGMQSRNRNCRHRFCTDCATRYVEHAVNEALAQEQYRPNDTGIRCPGVNCTYHLVRAEIVEYAGNKAYDRLADMHRRTRARMHETHYLDMRRNPAFRSYFNETCARPCPSCRVIVEKLFGCNHMVCRCGSQFCYNCGQGWNPGHICLVKFCVRCSLFGHEVSTCLTPWCKGCRQYGHQKADCTYVHIPKCIRCQTKGHVASACHTPKCDKCHRIGHVTGHTSDQCTAARCVRCNTFGHRARTCVSPYCSTCRAFGHTIMACPKTEFTPDENGDDERDFLAASESDVARAMVAKYVDDVVATELCDHIPELTLSAFLPPTFSISETDDEESNAPAKDTDCVVLHISVVDSIDLEELNPAHVEYTYEVPKERFEPVLPGLVPFSQAVKQAHSTTAPRLLPKPGREENLRVKSPQPKPATDHDGHQFDECVNLKFVAGMRLEYSYMKSKSNPKTQQKIRRRKEQSERDRAAAQAKRLVVVSEDCRSNKRVDRR